MKKNLSYILAALTGAAIIACTIVDCNVKKANAPYVPEETGTAESEILAGLFSTYLEGATWGDSYDELLQSDMMVAEGETVYQNNGISVPLMEYVYLNDVRTEFTLRFDDEAGLYEIDGKFEGGKDAYKKLEKLFDKNLKGFRAENGKEDRAEWVSVPIGEYYTVKELEDACIKAYPDDPGGTSVAGLIAVSNEFSVTLSADGMFSISAMKHLALTAMFE